ncbi:uncharacterized protein ACA1_054180 [Acanthamoeba castellanii str. Neff]|uniref:Myeloid-derived growth factor n=1 Tax=Acanthamoeba castellanii (strain ATCC 30010 / Neff) TaxID=1257118 RepID=L8H7H9_ACACF|nr:uncharacterized protein ACA1_054180 [Acanthamoeba castellanii str. Neff]ELR20673.1 hypothetical protein ACA1_054180 [Acanthamoeba castellanii str. Neff]
MKLFAVLATLALAAMVGLAIAGEDGVVEEDFHLRPGVEEQHVRIVSEEAGVACTFTYKCSGGTGENWKVRIAPVEANTYVCTVGRPNPPSYLLMSQFLLALEPAGTGASVKLTSADLHGGGKMVPSGQYVVDAELAQVRPSESWGGSLEQLTAVVEVTKKPAEKKKKKGGNKKKATTKKDNTHREEL